uniref:Uncharacterized protein n=1 Tax=Rhizophora mucronata TaxID=61149 RepID=A0A2P2PWN1_RHIMU
MYSGGDIIFCFCANFSKRCGTIPFVANGH